MEEKIYKELAEIRGRLISGIIRKAVNSAEYHKEKIEELNKTVSYICDKNMWDYCSILGKEDLIKLELLEDLIKKDEK